MHLETYNTEKLDIRRSGSFEAAFSPIKRTLQLLELQGLMSNLAEVYNNTFYGVPMIFETCNTAELDTRQSGCLSAAFSPIKCILQLLELQGLMSNLAEVYNNTFYGVPINFQTCNTAELDIKTIWVL